MSIKKEDLDSFFEEGFFQPKVEKRKHSTHRVFDDPYNKPITELETIGKQLVNKPITELETIGKQLVNKPITELETIGKQLVNKPITELETIGKQLVNKPITELETKNVIRSLLPALTGLSRKIIFALYQNCKTMGNNTTSNITLDYLSSIINSKKTCIKTIINRLKKKNFLTTNEYKTGRGGWVVYNLSQPLYLEIIKLENSGQAMELIINEGINSIYGKQLVNKPVTKPITQAITSVNSSSGNNLFYNLNTTTSDNKSKCLLSPEWQNIDIGPLAQINFTKEHLTAIAAWNKFTPQSVQNSIYAFAFDIKENKKLEDIDSDPLNYFMGILRKGEGWYLPPSNYESPQERYTRLYRERMAELEKKRVENEKATFDLAFRDWYSKLTPEQKKEFLPKSWSARSGADIEKSKIAEGSAKAHFEKELWPDIKQKIHSGWYEKQHKEEQMQDEHQKQQC